MQSKKVFALLLASIMTLSLISCNTGSTPEEVTSTEATEEVSEEIGSTEEVADNGTMAGFGNGLVDGAKVIDDNFDDNSTGEWHTYTNGGDFDLLAEDGQMVVDIRTPGNLEYSTQIYRDGYCLNNGCVYDVSFDIYSDIERDIEWRFQINGEDYRPYYIEEGRRITTEKQTITATFTMEEASDPAPRLCFNIGGQGDLDSKTPHHVYIDNFQLIIKDASNAMALEPLPTPVAIKVNQLGYKPNDTKVFVAKHTSEPATFDIIDVATGEVVYTGDFETDFINSKSNDGSLSHGDFSDFTTPGTYKISMEEYGESYEFTISDTVFDNIYIDTVRMLYLQRCGMELTEELAGDFSHPACHTEDATIYGTDKTIDVSGGWHDAGDYGRYVVPGAKTVADLLLTYEEYDASRIDDMNIPESGNGIPDILDEAKYELDWMLKMQASDGGVYHKVTCAVFPETVMPQEETAELIVSPISTTATGDFAAVMAKASVLYKEYDAAFAKTCLDASKKAYAYLEANADNDEVGFVNPKEITTGEYGDSKHNDEYFWAAMELYVATGDDSYLTKAAELYDDGVDKGLGWAAVGTYGIYTYLTTEESLQTNAELKEEFISYFEKTMSSDIMKIERDCYFVSLVSTYPWGSNMNVANNGMIYSMAAKVTGNDSYLLYARQQLDYLFGTNPRGYCYVTGYGTLSPSHVHHRPSQVVEASMIGMLVGGPNSAPEDPYAKAVLSSSSGGMCYVDNASSFSTNEITIYWNSPLVYLLGEFK